VEGEGEGEGEIKGIKYKTVHNITVAD